MDIILWPAYKYVLGKVERLQGTHGRDTVEKREETIRKQPAAMASSN
jgi:hypothetical protein